jgi:hypothetical protein
MKIVPKAEKSTNESKGKPEQKFDAAFGKLLAHVQKVLV